MCNSRRCKRAAFTVVELLLVIATLAVLISLSLPPLTRFRASAQELRCVRNVSQIGALLLQYTTDAKDLFPSWYSDRPSTPDQWRAYTGQVYRGLQHQAWLDHVGIPAEARLWSCPENQILRRGLVTTDFDYALSSSLFVEPSFLDPQLALAAWEARPGARLQAASSVMWPQHKVGAFEYEVWHGWRGRWQVGASTTGLGYYDSHRPGSAWYIDGHAALVDAHGIQRVDRYPRWGIMPFGTTPWGLAGRDLQRTE